MSSRFEAFLARLYVDEALRTRFISDPRATAAAGGLTSDELDAIASIDRIGLELASRSYAAKRVAQQPRSRGLLSALARRFLRR